MQPLVGVLENTNPETLKEANALLDLYKKRLDVDTCYLIDMHGNTIASSNRDEPDSLWG
jgi:C4-dicarboxylate-specific signal transduction histidine kinase